MFKWSEKYITGHKAIDEQHEELFSVIESVENMLVNSSDVSSDKLSEAFEGLLHYTIYHFSTEEEFWQVHDQALYNYQRKEHEAFVSQLESLDVNLIESNGRVYVDQLMVQLSDWVVNHVETEIEEMKDLISKRDKSL